LTMELRCSCWRQTDVGRDEQLRAQLPQEIGSRYNPIDPQAQSVLTLPGIMIHWKKRNMAPCGVIGFGFGVDLS
jgi:hypothetical protein